MRGAVELIAAVALLWAGPVAAQEKLPRILIPRDIQIVKPEAKPVDKSQDERAGYRLIATGFRVVRQTVDHMLEADGRGDEIFVRGDRVLLDHAGGRSGLESVRTEPIGHMLPNPAGSGQAGPFSATGDGGLVSGDTYPPQSPYSTAPSRRRADLPLVLWEGELTRGRSGVLVVPSVWEWDGFTETVEEVRWTNSLTGSIEQLSGILGQRIGEGSPEWLLRRDLFVTVTNVGNRPIGSREAPGGLGGPGTVVGRVVPTRFPAILLTYESAAALSSMRMDDPYQGIERDGLVTRADITLPMGVFGISYRDPEELGGHYILYLKLERI